MEPRMTVPWLGPAARTAVSGSPSISLSLPSTPGAGTVSGVFSLVVYELFAATGAWFTLVTVIDTVAVFDRVLLGSLA